MTETIEPTEPQDRMWLIDVEPTAFVSFKIKTSQEKAPALAEAARKARDSEDEKTSRPLFLLVSFDESEKPGTYKCHAVIPENRFRLALEFLQEACEKAGIAFQDLEAAEPEIPPRDENHHHRRKHRGPGGL